MFVDFQPRRRRRRYLRSASLGRPAPGAARRPSGAEDGRRAAIKASRAHSTPVSDIYPPRPGRECPPIIMWITRRKLLSRTPVHLGYGQSYG